MNVLYPDFVYKNVQSINFEELKKIGVKGFALDVDNTLIDFDKKLSEEVKEWVKKLKRENFKVCILSNTNKVLKVQKVSKELKLEYIQSAKKPFKGGYQKAVELLKLQPSEIAMVGDQIFTDVLGANLMKMVSVYVEPIDKRDFWYTAWKRPMEAWILKCYSKKKAKAFEK